MSLGLIGWGLDLIRRAWAGTTSDDAVAGLAPTLPPANPILRLRDRINGERAKAGLTPLNWDHRLDVAAQQHARFMASTLRLGHYGIGDGAWYDRIAKAGYLAEETGEIVAEGQRDADEAVDAWMASPGHRAEILSTRFADFGLGVWGNGPVLFWCCCFGRPRP